MGTRATVRWTLSPGAVAAWALVLLLLLPAHAGAKTVEVQLDPAAGVCGVSGWFLAPVSVAVAWDVLTDYDHIPDYVHSMVASHRERDAGGALRVRQTASAGVFIFRRHMNVLLAIAETPHRRIAFHDVLGKDFEHYTGNWRIERISSGTRVSYSLAAEPKGALPRRMCRGALRKSAASLLGQVRTEMLRRSKLAPRQP